MFNIMKHFPESILIKLQEIVKKEEYSIQEIRVRVNCPIIIKINNKEDAVINHIVTNEEILQILQSICEHSIYSFQNEISSRIHNYSRWT